MQIDELRITKVREYLIGIINEIVDNPEYSINAYMLANEPNNYSLDKIPTENVVVEKWITGKEFHKDVYSFRSRMNYSQETITNLENVGFYEIFEAIIKSNNEQGILPNIEGIRKIECLNSGSMTNAETNTAEFDIQIQIEYEYLGMIVPSL